MHVSFFPFFLNFVFVAVRKLIFFSLNVVTRLKHIRKFYGCILFCADSGTFFHAKSISLLGLSAPCRCYHKVSDDPEPDSSLCCPTRLLRPAVDPHPSTPQPFKPMTQLSCQPRFGSGDSLWSGRCPLAYRLPDSQLYAVCQ